MHLQESKSKHKDLQNWGADELVFIYSTAGEMLGYPAWTNEWTHFWGHLKHKTNWFY